MWSEAIVMGENMTDDVEWLARNVRMAFIPIRYFKGWDTLDKKEKSDWLDAAKELLRGMKKRWKIEMKK